MLLASKAVAVARRACRRPCAAPAASSGATRRRERTMSNQDSPRRRVGERAAAGQGRRLGDLRAGHRARPGSRQRRRHEPQRRASHARKDDTKALYIGRDLAQICARQSFRGGGRRTLERSRPNTPRLIQSSMSSNRVRSETCSDLTDQPDRSDRDRTSRPPMVSAGRSSGMANALSTRTSPPGRRQSCSPIRCRTRRTGRGRRASRDGCEVSSAA